MESLLRWGIENSAPVEGENLPPPVRQDIDPGIIDHILGKPDSVLMKEALALAVDDSQLEEARATALDDFEMLIEQIDNANNITTMQMWQPLIKLLDSPLESIRLGALWILGTAVQNNHPAQTAFLSFDPIPTLLGLLSFSRSSDGIRSKALYCLSGTLNHNRAALESFEKAQGWSILTKALSDSSIVVRRKAAFLLNTLLLPNALTSDSTSTGPSPYVAKLTSTSELAQDAMRKENILPTVINSLASPEPRGPDGDQVDLDMDYGEKALRVVITFLDNGGSLLKEEKGALQPLLKDEGKREDWGLSQGEWQNLKQIIS